MFWQGKYVVYMRNAYAWGYILRKVNCLFFFFNYPKWVIIKNCHTQGWISGELVGSSETLQCPDSIFHLGEILLTSGSWTPLPFCVPFATAWNEIKEPWILVHPCRALSKNRTSMSAKVMKCHSCRRKIHWPVRSLCLVKVNVSEIQSSCLTSCL